MCEDYANSKRQLAAHHDKKERHQSADEADALARGAKQCAIAIRAIPLPGVVCVPREPTDDMVEAGELQLRDYEKNPETRYFAESFGCVRNIYKAMLSAAQKEGG